MTLLIFFIAHFLRKFVILSKISKICDFFFLNNCQNKFSLQMILFKYAIPPPPKKLCNLTKIVKIRDLLSKSELFSRLLFLNLWFFFYSYAIFLQKKMAKFATNYQNMILSHSWYFSMGDFVFINMPIFHQKSQQIFEMLTIFVADIF